MTRFLILEVIISAERDSTLSIDLTRTIDSQSMSERRSMKRRSGTRSTKVEHGTERTQFFGIEALLERRSAFRSHRLKLWKI